MGSRLLKKLESSATKAEEIAWLELVASQVGRGTYLDSLFTEELVAWVSKQIRDDLSCNVFMALEASWDELSSALTHAQTAESEVEEARIKLRLAQDTIEEDALRVKQLEARLGAEQERVASLRAKLVEAGERAWEAEREAERLKRQVTELKAALWDAQQEGNDG